MLKTSRIWRGPNAQRSRRAQPLAVWRVEPTSLVGRRVLSSSAVFGEDELLVDPTSSGWGSHHGRSSRSSQRATRGHAANA
ncbi:MAG: hypothetical protein BGO98_25455 [Myxococcales bacterium 68-20]|nr:MAG: hypothetical protein BGO98_25455 [Myxococcales bacterium 68-20]